MDLIKFDISVVIPVYNSEKTIKRAIDSILFQTFPAFEIIVINDGSKDATEEILFGYHEKIKYVKLKQNSGVSVARNIGIKKAAGNWIAFLDADDSWLPEKLEAQVRLIKANPTLKWCLTNYKLWSSNFEEINVKNKPPSSICEIHQLYGGFDGYVFDNYFETARKGFCTALTSSVLIQKDVFKAVGVFDPTLIRSQDLDLWFRIALWHPRVGYIHNPLSEKELYNGDDALMMRRVIAKKGHYLRRAYKKNLNEAKCLADKSQARGSMILNSFVTFASINLFNSILMMVFLGHTDMAKETFLQFNKLFAPYRKMVLKIVVIFPFMPRIVRLSYFLAQKSGLASRNEIYWEYLRLSRKHGI